MKRVPYEEMVAQFARVLEKKGFTASDAQDAAIIFAQNSLAGVFSHGLNRFPRVVSYLEKGEIDPAARATCVSSMGSIERWDGHRGFGPLNAKRAMDRACELAKQNGVGVVALGKFDKIISDDNFFHMSLSCLILKTSSRGCLLYRCRVEVDRQNQIYISSRIILDKAWSLRIYHV